MKRKKIIFKDFKLLGEARVGVVSQSDDFNILIANKNATREWFWTFCVGDDLKTNRGITFGDSIKDVFDEYADTELFEYNEKSDVLVNRSLSLSENDKGDFKTFIGDETYCEYSAEVVFSKVFIRFYFGQDKKVKLIGFYNEIINDKLLEYGNKWAFINKNVRLLYSAKKKTDIVKKLEGIINDLVKIDDFQVKYLLAELYENSNILYDVDYNKAIKIRKEINKREKNFLNIKFIGDDYFILKDYKNAKNAYIDAIKIFPTYHLAMQLISTYYLLVNEDEKRFDKAQIDELVNLGEIVVDDGLRILLHQNRDTYEFDEVFATLPRMIGQFGGILYRLCNDYKKAYKIYNLTLQLYDYLDKNDEESVEIQKNIRAIMKEIKNKYDISFESDNIFENIEKLLKYEKLPNQINTLVDDFVDIKYTVDKIECNIDGDKYKYLVLGRNDAAGNIYPFFIDSEKYCRIHPYKLLLRVEKDKTEYNDDMQFINIVGNTFISDKDVNCHNLEIKGNLTYEAKPQILFHIKNLLCEMKEWLKLVECGKKPIKEFYDEYFNKVDMTKLVPMVSLLNKMGFVWIATPFENIDYHLFKYKLIEPYGIDYTIYLIDRLLDDIYVYIS